MVGTNTSRVPGPAHGAAAPPSAGAAAGAPPTCSTAPRAADCTSRHGVASGPGTVSVTFCTPPAVAEPLAAAAPVAALDALAVAVAEVEATGGLALVAVAGAAGVPPAVDGGVCGEAAVAGSAAPSAVLVGAGEVEVGAGGAGGVDLVGVTGRRAVVEAATELEEVALGVETARGVEPAGGLMSVTCSRVQHQGHERDAQPPPPPPGARQAQQEECPAGRSSDGARACFAHPHGLRAVARASPACPAPERGSRTLTWACPWRAMASAASAVATSSPCSSSSQPPRTTSEWRGSWLGSSCTELLRTQRTATRYDAALHATRALGQGLGTPWHATQPSAGEEGGPEKAAAERGGAGELPRDEADERVLDRVPERVAPGGAVDELRAASGGEEAPRGAQDAWVGRSHAAPAGRTASARGRSHGPRACDTLMWP